MTTIPSLPRLVYLSSGSHARELLAWLETQQCEIVLAQLNGQRTSAFPPYDLGLAIFYNHRIPESEFVTPRKWVNVHPAPLPDYRGRNVAYHAIMDGATTFGATIHYMSPEYDMGDIIEVRRFDLLDSYTAGDLTMISQRLMIELFKEYVPRLLVGDVSATPQSEGRYFRKQDLDETLELTKEQERRVRALTAINVSPTFHAKINIAGKRYRIIPDDAPEF